MTTARINLESLTTVMAPRETNKTQTLYSRLSSARITVCLMPLKNIALSLSTWDILPQTPWMATVTPTLIQLIAEVTIRSVQTPKRVRAVAPSNKHVVRSSTHCTIASIRRFQSLASQNNLLNLPFITTTTKVVNAVLWAAVVTTNAPWSCTMLQCLSQMMVRLKLETMRSGNREMRSIIMKIREINSKTFTKWYRT